MTEPEVTLRLSYLQGKDNEIAELRDALREAEYQLHNLTSVAQQVLAGPGAPVELVVQAVNKLQKQVGAAQAYEYKAYTP